MDCAALARLGISFGDAIFFCGHYQRRKRKQKRVVVTPCNATGNGWMIRKCFCHNECNGVTGFFAVFSGIRRPVAQVSKPAGSPISKSAARDLRCGQRAGKPATQQTWKSALQAPTTWTTVPPTENVEEPLTGPDPQRAGMDAREPLILWSAAACRRFAAPGTLTSP